MAMKLGLLGMWHSHADGLVRQAASHPDEFRLAGFWDPEPDVVRDRSARWKGLVPGFRLFDRPEDLLKEPLDGVVVEGRVHENLGYARRALEAGFPVMLEKPAGTSLEEHRRLIELARSKHLHVQMIYLFRYMSATLEMLRRARSGELGSIYFFRARLPKALGDYERFEEELKLYRGGIFFEMAGHVIDMMVAILGKPKAVAPFLGHHHPTRPGAFVDNGLAVFEYERAWGLIEVPQLEVAPNARRIEVYGTKGACAIPHLGSGHLANREVQPIEVYREGEKYRKAEKDREGAADRGGSPGADRGGASGWETLNLPAATLHISDLREFAACVARKKEPDYSLEHDLIVEEALLRASGMA